MGRVTGSAALATATISGLAVYHLRLPVKSVRKHGIGDVSSKVDVVYAAVSTSEGVVGWGEASPWPLFTGTAEANAAALDRYLRPAVIGQRLRDIPAVMQTCDRTLVGHFEAKAALESALFDAAGKTCGLPAYQLLGGGAQDRVRLSVSLADPDMAADLDLLDRIAADGVTMVKVKTGFADHRIDLERLDAFRKARPEIEIRVDYNQGLEPFGALARLRDVEVFEPTFIEQPVPAAQTEAMADLSASLDTPILADESVFGLTDLLKGIEARIARGVSVKIMKCGGMRAGQAIATAAAAAGWSAYGGDMFETGLAHRAGLHMIAATPAITLGCEFYQSRYYLEHDPVARPLELVEGCLVVPQEPGLGAPIDTEILSHHTVNRSGDDLPS